MPEIVDRGTGVLRDGLIAGGLLSLVVASQAWATSSNIDHQLSVFSIENYGPLSDAHTGVSVQWKEAIPVSSALDAYGTFYNAMTGCSSDSCAHADSHRFHDSEVTVNALLNSTSSSGGILGTSGADMVFFYGHNISMQEWNLDKLGFDAWMPYNATEGGGQTPINGTWFQLHIECPNCILGLDSWGNTLPYYYHQTNTNTGQTGIQDASSTKSYGVFYAYNPLTSMLIGKDFTTGTWQTENQQNFGSDSAPTARSGRLGSGDPEFLVANGCEGVPVAHYQNHAPQAGTVVWSNQAQQQFKPSWRLLHLVVGHYYTTSTNCLPNVTHFANDLKAGVGVMPAYFAAHITCAGNPSSPGEYQPGALAPRNTYDTDKWAAPELSNPTTTDEAAANWFRWAVAAQ